MTQTALQPYTGEKAEMQARLALLAAYSPKEHLVIIQSKQGQKPYYPAAWRLYELSLRYSDANFKSEITFMDVEKNLVIVKAYLYLGPDYDSSPKKAEAFKQGKLSELDKVETGAKARAARDFGISTELALDMEDDSVDGGEVTSTLARSEVVNQATPQNGNGQPHLTSALLREKAKSLGYDERKFSQAVRNVLHVKEFPTEFSSTDLHKINNFLDSQARQSAGGGR